MTVDPAYDERFVHFVVLFNVDADYFECHEVMEELWLEEGRSLLYQGLLQAAVGLHHWRNDNYSGAVKLFDQAENKLVQYPNVRMGLDLGQLRADIARCVAPLRHWVTMMRSGEQAIGPAGDEVGIEASNTKVRDTCLIVGPPIFVPFELVVVDENLRLLAKVLAEIPLEVRLHNVD
ncbi:hypothetical protein Back11_06820 [Paenibacillus baekrokdamisoli]|uniref:Uncharacterized protein n=1 Tax=Paenibacillus baekrokdamisoli TaxID=1712516 RepID=A0A3G9IK11_9BACL|nr:DUF309 domain-containing protein [Paenibacillus baekrokdamisoli]MBB3067477.1 hypothetical protein [Paenibacillus baekrokdamisoli]BBH19337.1 hypothetical protein Back11_06820 [Paenibacillus baekrokdamisoli]